MQILRSTLRAMRHLSATSDVRRYINGVCVEVVKGHGILIATDGSLMGAHAFDVDPGEPDAQFIIPIEAIKGLKANGATVVEITHDAGKITLRDGPTVTQVKAVDGRFPDWRRVMPSKPSGEHAHYNPDLVARFADTGRDLFGRGTKQCPLLWANGSAAGLVHFEGYLAFRGAVMPRFYRPGERPVAPDYAPTWAVQ